MSMLKITSMRVSLPIVFDIEPFFLNDCYYRLSPNTKTVEKPQDFQLCLQF